MMIMVWSDIFTILKNEKKNRNSEMGRFRADQEERYLEMIQNPLERTWTFRILEHNSGT